MYYDSYWESLKFTPAERDAWRETFPPAAPDQFEIAPRTARRWADAGFSPEQARATFEAAGLDHHQARRWKWTDPATAIAWMEAAFDAEKGEAWALVFSLEEALAWRGAGFSPDDAKRWSHLVGAGHPQDARLWISAGFDLEEAEEAIRKEEPLEVARFRRAAADAPLGKENGGVRGH